MTENEDSIPSHLVPPVDWDEEVSEDGWWERHKAAEAVKEWFNTNERNVEMENTVTPYVHETRWGFVPCSYELYKKIKRLNFLYCKNLKELGRHRRFYRKEPQNRVRKEYTFNENGQRNGYTTKPLSTPTPCEVFDSHGTVPCCYEMARRPVSSPEAAPELPYTEEVIDSMLAEAELWYKDQ